MSKGIPIVSSEKTAASRGAAGCDSESGDGGNAPGILYVGILDEDCNGRERCWDRVGIFEDAKWRIRLEIMRFAWN